MIHLSVAEMLFWLKNMESKESQKINEKATEIVKIVCNECKKNFGMDKEYIGIINCPYCQAYVEG